MKSVYNRVLVASDNFRRTGLRTRNDHVALERGRVAVRNLSTPPRQLVYPTGDCIERLSIPSLGVSVTPMDLEQLACVIDGTGAGSRTKVIAGHNLHSVYLSHVDEAFRHFYEQADVVLLDGMPLLWFSNFSLRRKYLSSKSRLGSTDWVPTLAARFSKILVVGADANINASTVRVLAAAAPRSRVFGLPGAAWGESKEHELMRQIQSLRPDLVLLGLGMPLQERVATEIRKHGDVKWIATVGGAIDQLAGTQKLAPHWIGRLGLEWAWRLAGDPRRLAYRYLYEPLKLVRILVSR